MRQLIEISFALENTTINEILDSSSAGNNVSNPSILEIATATSGRGYKGYIFANKHGEWPSISDGSYNYFPDEGYNGYMSRQLSAADSSCDVSLIFNFVGNVPNYLSIQFDRVCNEFATKMRISNNQNSTITNVNNRSFKSFASIANMNLGMNAAITARVLEWNKPFKTVKVTRISFGYVGEFDENVLEAFKCSENLLTENFNITAGILEQYADITLRDKYQELVSLSSAGLLTRDLEVSIYAIDDTELDSDGFPKKYLQGTYITNTWKLDGTSNLVNLSCTDKSNKFPNIQVPAIDIKNRTLNELLTLLFSYVAEYTFEYIDAETHQYASSTFTPNSWIYAGTFEESFAKALQLGKMRAFWSVDKFILARCY